jgi:hypothetical protein
MEPMTMDAEIFVPFIFFAFLTSIIVVPVMAKERTRRSAHQLISQAIARGQELDPSTISRMTDEMLDNYGGGRARRTFGNAIVLLALAAGFLGSGYMLSNIDHDGDVLYGMAVPAVILGSVGAAFLLLSIVDFAAKKRTA